MENINFIAVDFETATALRSSICEVGITIVQKGQITISKNWLVQPPNNEYDVFNIYIHGITPEETKNAPLFSEVWQDIFHFLNNQTIIAHNTGFDMYALRDVLDYYNISYPNFDFYCSYRVSKYIFNDCYSYSLPIICNHIGVKMTTHHRAKDDSRACAELFLKCLQEIDCHEINSLEDIFNFKKGYFGKSVFRPQLANPRLANKQLVSQIVGDPSKFEEGNIFFDKNVCFTGTCQYGIRANLLQKIADIGGHPVNSVTKNTDYLIVGQQDYRVVGDSGMSSKQRKALDMREKGLDIQILSEEEFLKNI